MGLSFCMLKLKLLQILRIWIEFSAIGCMSQRHHPNPLEHRRVLRLAREYRRHGYDVTVYPEAEALPSALAKYPFDLIAKADDRVIAVEVRTRENLTLNGLEDLRRMTEKVNQVPGWDFELVVTNPRPRVSQHHDTPGGDA